MITREFSWSSWRERAGSHFAPRDVPRLLSEVALAGLRLAAARDRELGKFDGLDARDPDMVDVVLDLARVIGERYFRYRVEGVDNVPARGPALLVGSHNGGLQTFDSLLTLIAIRDRFGVERAVHPLAHDLLFQAPRLREVSEGLGILRADHEGALEAFRRGRLVLVYPGSDLDSTRPFKDRHRIELGGRTGFLKLALRASVPIVPVVSEGTHEQFIVLTRGDELARRLGIKRWFRAEAFPIVLALPWGIVPGYLPYLPLPAQTTVRFGPPIHLPQLGADATVDSHTLQECYRQVEHAMQRELDVLARGRVPFLGRPQDRRPLSDAAVRQ
ncbi:MAG: lysophospholipid acyltransferase family protein [Polyangiaceae bacterium]